MVTAAGHAVLAQIAASSALASQMTPCGSCLTPSLMKPAKKCNGCKIVQYCSKECQRSEWSRHKALCHLVEGNEKTATAFLSSMEPIDVVTFVVDMYRYKVLWNEKHLGSLVELLGPKISPVFHLPKRSIRGSRTEADFDNFLQGAVAAGILPKYMNSRVALKGCIEGAVHSGNADSLFIPAEIESLAAKYKNANIDVPLLILAERVVGFDAGGPPQGLLIWMDGFGEAFKASPKATDYVQQIEIDRITSRVAKGNAQNPNPSKFSDRFRGQEHSPEAAALMDNFLKNFDRGDSTALEQLLTMQKQIAPDNLEVQRSIEEMIQEMRKG